MWLQVWTLGLHLKEDRACWRWFQQLVWDLAGILTYRACWHLQHCGGVITPQRCQLQSLEPALSKETPSWGRLEPLLLSGKLRGSASTGTGREAARSAPALGNNRFSSLVSPLLPWGTSSILRVLLPELIGVCCASDAWCLHA